MFIEVFRALASRQRMFGEMQLAERDEPESNISRWTRATQRDCSQDSRLWLSERVGPPWGSSGQNLSHFGLSGADPATQSGLQSGRYRHATCRDAWCSAHCCGVLSLQAVRETHVDELCGAKRRHVRRGSWYSRSVPMASRGVVMRSASASILTARYGSQCHAVLTTGDGSPTRTWWAARPTAGARLPRCLDGGGRGGRA